MNSKHSKYVAAVVAVALTACSTEELVGLYDGDPAQLAIVTTVGATQDASSVSVATRAGVEAGVDALSENTLGNTLDIFIAGTDYWNQYHLTDVTAGTEHLLTYDCLSGDKALDPAKTYRVYVSANSSLTNGNIASEADLKALSVTDADIYRHEGTNAGKGEQEGKRFLMDYCNDSWIVSGTAKNTINAQMSRAAVKFKVKVKFDDTFYNTPPVSDGYTINSPAWRLFNCNTAAPLFANDDAVTPVLSTAPRFSLDKTTDDVYDIVTYSYPFSWTDPVEGAPYILFSYQLMKDGKSDNAFHYYRIPLTDLTSIKRNHVYEVTATIKSLGSTKPVASTTDVDLNYKVVDWTEDNAAFSGVEVNYIIAEPDFTVLQGDGNLSATIGITVPKRIWDQGESGVKIQNFKSYYKNSSNTNVNTSDTQSGVLSIDYTNHTLTVNSSALSNHAVKYINFEVYYVDGDRNTHSQKVYFKHYPAESIEPLESWWVSRNDPEWVRYANPKRKGTYYANVSKTTNKFFYAKAYYNGKRYHLDSSGNLLTTGTEASITDANNNMYIIQLTSPGSTYSIGHYANEQERVASPAFLIASELGAINNRDTYSISKQHCADYLEVAADGTEYTGWRLPTISELQIISKYQNATETQAIMSTVLPKTSDTYYSITNGVAVRPSDASEQPYSTTSSTVKSGYVRAVRDLTIEEVERLRNRKE